MTAILNRRRVYSGEKLPYDAKIEYLRSTGTQWIDTGIPDSFSGLIVTLDMTLPLASEEHDFFGGAGHSMQDFNYAGFFSNLNNNFVLQLGRNYVCYGTNDSLRHTHIYNAITKKVHYDASITDASLLGWGLYPGQTFRIFQRIDWFGKNNSPSDNTLYSSKFERDGVLIRDYIPVRIGTTGYMYDKVSGQLFGNQGTGDFILGPDI